MGVTENGQRSDCTVAGMLPENISVCVVTALCFQVNVLHVSKATVSSKILQTNCIPGSANIHIPQTSIVFSISLATESHFLIGRQNHESHFLIGRQIKRENKALLRK